MTMLTRAQAARRIGCRECRAMAGDACLDMRPGFRFRGRRIKGTHDLRVFDLEAEARVSFSYATGEQDAAIHLVNRYGIAADSAAFIVHYAMLQGAYVTDSFTAWIAGHPTNTINIEDAA